MWFMILTIKIACNFNGKFNTFEAHFLEKSSGSEIDKLFISFTTSSWLKLKKNVSNFRFFNVKVNFCLFTRLKYANKPRQPTVNNDWKVFITSYVLYKCFNNHIKSYYTKEFVGYFFYSLNIMIKRLQNL